MALRDPMILEFFRSTMHGTCLNKQQYSVALLHSSAGDLHDFVQAQLYALRSMWALQKDLQHAVSSAVYLCVLYRSDGWWLFGLPLLTTGSSFRESPYLVFRWTLFRQGMLEEEVVWCQPSGSRHSCSFQESCLPENSR